MISLHDQPPKGARGSRTDPEQLRLYLNGEIERLNRFSLRGILAMALFLGASALAWQGFPLLPGPDQVIALLGPPPAAGMVSTALLIYTFSAIVLSLFRMTAGIEHRSSFGHVGFLAGFYLFYHFGRALDENFWAVFGAGVTILGVESYRIWSFCAEGVTRSREDIDYITRTGKIPPQE